MSIPTISTIVTILVIIMLLFFLIKGWRKGFLRILFSTFSILITIIISAMLTAPTASWLQEDTFVGRTVEERVSKYVDEKTSDLLPGIAGESNSASQVSTGASGKEDMSDSASDGSGSGSSIFSNISDFLGSSKSSESEESSEISTQDDFIDSLLLPEFIKSIIKGENTAEDYARMQVENFQQYITLQITTIIVRIIAFLLLMILIYVVLRLVLHLIKFIDKIPIIHGVNRLLGAILGLAEALLIIWLICLLLSLFAGSQFGADALKVIRSSSFLTFLYENNLISKAFHAIFSAKV